MNRNTIALALVGVFCVSAAAARAAEEQKMLFGFEADQDLGAWEFKQKTGQLSDQHVTQGGKALKVATGESMTLKQPMDWSAHEAVDIDVFVESDEPAQVWIYIVDQAGAKKLTYWNQHDGSMMLRPGKSTVSIPTTGLFRGEQGSRNNDIKSNIDPATIVQWSLNFVARKDAQRAIYLDNIRLVKSGPRPAEILAFDLGPDSQTVCPGFTPIGPTTVHGQNGNKVGLKAGVGPSFARDSTFPTRLYQDYIMMEGSELVIDLPDGKYKAWVVYEDSGYWGGEAAKFKQRTITANGKVVDTEDRGEAGLSEYLFAYEKIEPRPGDSLWELYVKALVAPRRFEVEVTGGRVALGFQGGSILNTKVAAVVLYPANSAIGEKWVADAEAMNRAEFETAAVFAGPFPKELAVPEAAKAAGYWVGYPTLDQTVTLADAPGAEQAKLHRLAALNQRVSMTFAVRPLKDLGPVQLTASDLKGDAGTIPAGNVDLRYAHHTAKRIIFTLGYHIAPYTLRHLGDGDLQLTKDLTRQFWITVHVPADAKAGTYSGQVTLKAGETNVNVPVSIEVLGMKLDEPDYAMGFYGAYLPAGIPWQSDQGWRMLMGMLKDNGMNSFTGGPNLVFKGLDETGKPIIEGYKELDEFFRVCRELGYDKPVMAYGGPGALGGLHEGYIIGKTGRDWEKKTGKAFEDLLKIVWDDIQQHAKEHNWLPIAYGMTDEPRVLENALEQLELMKAYKKAVPSLSIGGSYSVHWDKTDPLSKAIQDIFKTLDWSALNVHSQADVDKTREFNKALWIYNQGLSRFSFGAYQWAEMRKGVKGRMQWHTLAISGYQYLDLDGREPDFAAVMWGREQIYPTIALPRCRDGADDFRFAVTLWNLAQKNKDKPEAQAAIAWLQQVADAIPAGQRNAVPEALKDEEAFRAKCADYLRQLTK